tara:strand:- start:1466 stop:2101 length:636 start_codon:yes stop_codon:yes gene_type:complete
MKNTFFLDFETNGLNPYLNDVIEIAIKKMNEEGHYQTFVKPKKMPKGSLYEYVPPDIIKLTGITDKVIAKKGIEKSVATYNMLKFIEDNSSLEEPIYIVSHNGNSFDFLFLRRMIYEYENSKCLGINQKVIENIKYIDTILLAKLFIEKGRFNQKVLCERYGIINEDEHRALGDILALEKLYIELSKEYSKYKGKEEEYYLEKPEELNMFI